MNPVRVMVMAICALLPWAASGQTTHLFDGFSGLDSFNWVDSTFVGGTVYVDGGLHLINRGRITTNSANWVFDQPVLTITGTIRFVSSDDIFNVVLRSTGNYSEIEGQFGEATNGLKVSFGPYFGGVLALDDVAFLGEGNIGINHLYDDFISGGMEAGSTYDFVVAASGPNIFFTMGSTGTELPEPFLLGTTSGYYGSRIGFYNRENSGESHTAVISELDIVGIAIPEPSVTGVLFGATGLMGAWYLRRRNLAAVRT